MMKTRDIFRPYQLDGMDLVKSNRGTGLFFDMGGGKTAVSLTAYSDMLDDFEIVKPLIIAPLLVSKTVWHIEATEWEHLQHLSFSIITGTQKDRINAINTKADFYVINVENVQWLVDHLNKKWDFDSIIIDESSKFKNHQTKRFRALKRVMKRIKKITLLSGTPSPRSYMDLWSQLFLLDQGERLGKNIGMYRRTYFDSDNYMKFTNYTLRQGSKETIQNKIKDICMYVPTEGNVDLPDKISIVRDVPLDNKLKKKYKEFEEDMVLSMDDLEDTISAVSAATLSNKLLQFSSGAVYYDEQEGYEVIHDLKFQALDEIIEENPDEPLLIAYNYKHELERLIKKYPDLVVMDKKRSLEIVKDWNENKIDKLAVHPASAGHGLNMQKGRGSIIIFIGFTWSLEDYLQLIKRLHRSGQKHVVRIIHIAVGDVEYKLMKKLSEKDVTQQELLEALKR